MKIKKLMGFIGACFGLGSTVILAYVFFNAYFHGMETIIMINVWGEANIEVGIILAMLVFTGYSFVEYLKRN